MPFTPFHMGPGVVVKAALGRHFSLMVFGFTQVAMDIEPLARMLGGDVAPHGLSHTYAGAAVIGALAVVIGRPVCNWLLRFWPRAPERPFFDWLRGPGNISWTGAATGAFIGAFTHVFLDSIMHAEMRPLWPVTDRNGLLNLVSMEALHFDCLAAGVVGAMALVVRWIVWREKGVGGSESGVQSKLDTE
jgi:hypothetical protein